MNIKEFIIHEIAKEAHKEPTIHLRKQSLKATDARVKKFTELAIKVFATHEDRPSSVFADFNQDVANYPFSEWCLSFFPEQQIS